MQVERTFHFDAAHRLMNHAGKCCLLHGHTYRLDVILVESLPRVPFEVNDCMIMDFGEIDKRVRGWLDKSWDHGVILNEKDEELVKFLRPLSRVCTLPGDPTAERMVGALVSVHLPKMFPEIRSVGARLWEGEKSAVFAMGSSV